MTAAKIMDIISRLPGCDGQAADAVSAYTQVKMEDAHKLLKIPKSECPDIWIRLPRHKWPKSWSSMEDTVVPLERNLYGHPLAGLLWVRQFEKILLKHGWEKIPNWECLFVHREKGLFLSVYVDDIKLAETGFTQFTLLSEKPPDGFLSSLGETDKTASDIQSRSVMARTLYEIGKKC